MKDSKSFDAHIESARAARDAELASDTTPLMKMSWVKKRQRQVGPVILLLMALWVASIFAISTLVRPLMDINDWYGLLIIAWLFPSFAVKVARVAVRQRFVVAVKQQASLNRI